MLLDPQRRLELPRFRRLLESAAPSLPETARTTRLDRKTIRKYPSPPGPATPPRRPPNGRSRARTIDEHTPLADAILRTEVLTKAAVIHERLVTEHESTGNYQRVTHSIQQTRPKAAGKLRITPKELAGTHRQFEVSPGAQAQADRSDKGKAPAHIGTGKVYPFHMTLSYSRDPFCRPTTNQDPETFLDRHRRTSAHFGGAPTTIAHDRTKPAVRRHAAPGQAVPLHPETVEFARHYNYGIHTLTAHRPTRKGRALRLRHPHARRPPAHREGAHRATGPDRPRPHAVRASPLPGQGNGHRVHGCSGGEPRSTKPTAK